MRILNLDHPSIDMIDIRVYVWFIIAKLVYKIEIIISDNMATDSVTDLVRQLQILNTCSLDDDISHLTLENNEQSLEINSKVTEKLNAYLTAVKENEKIIDPAIKKQREKLPIFQEKNKLIEVIYMFIFNIEVFSVGVLYQ